MQKHPTPSTDNNTYRFNLGVVLRETGVKADTLRAWERRYGLPSPQRSEGGHRLYSQEDIDTIKWLIARQKEGMRISNAVKLWKKILQDGKDPFNTPGAPHAAKEINLRPSVDITGLDALQKAWVEACLDYDEARADQVLTQSFALFPLETVCSEVLEKGLEIIGEKWYQNKINSQQEHFATSLASRKINSLIAAAPRPTRKERLIIGCTPGENHSFPGLLLTLISRYRGWDVIYLGADVPQEHMDATLQVTGAKILILTAMQLHTAAALVEIAENIKGKNALLGYNGHIFSQQPGLTGRIPGFYLGDSIPQAVNTIEKLTEGKPRIQQPLPPAKAYQIAFSSFNKNQLLIEAYILENISCKNCHEHYPTVANFFLSEKIKASLIFGSIDLLEHELGYSKKLLEYRHIQEEVFKEFILIYLEGIKKVMPEDGKIISDWLEGYLARTKG